MQYRLVHQVTTRYLGQDCTKFTTVVYVLQVKILERGDWHTLQAVDFESLSEDEKKEIQKSQKG